MNNAELIVATLRAAGVSHGFGIPSGNVLLLIEAMRVGRLPYVLTAHEGSAAFMADVMGRLTGAPGLCIATLGPGARCSGSSCAALISSWGSATTSWRWSMRPGSTRCRSCRSTWIQWMRIEA